MFTRFLIGLAIFQTSLAMAGEWVEFPKDFKWCVATSAHQIEGYNVASDWWDFENQTGRILNGDRSGPACDHWHRMTQDIGLMQDLGVKTYRMSIEWSKIEPSEGVLDENAIEHYRSEISELERAGISPFITLHHFTFPRWVREKRAWEWEGLPDALDKYTEIVYTRIAPGRLNWVTINEPMVAIMGGYYEGAFTPGEKRSLQGLLPVIRGVLKSHARIYHRLHELADARGVPIRVGSTHSLSYFYPHNRFNPMDRLGVSFAKGVMNWLIPHAIATGKLELFSTRLHIYESIPELKGTLDYFGVNYYSGSMVHFSFRHGFEIKHDPQSLQSDLFWDIKPEGIYEVLKDIQSRNPDLPIMILENGIADSTDRYRGKFIQDHLKQVARAMREGVPVEGYCHWSLLDNFEWAQGFTPRFGLYEMDYSTFERKPRESALMYQKLIRENGFSLSEP